MTLDRDRREALKLGLKLVLGAAGLVLVIALLGHYFRAELEDLGRTFLDRFGYVGIAFGTYIADGLHLTPLGYQILTTLVRPYLVAAAAATPPPAISTASR